MGLNNIIAELIAEREKLSKELNEIMERHKWTEKDIAETSAYITRRWVRSRGYVYVYYYLIVRHRGRIVKNKYLGKVIPKGVQEQVEDLKRARKILRRIKSIDRSLKRIEKELGRVVSRE
ncbi:MAG: hypothetical protein ACXQTI_03625 [Candidatus Nezhaarchaeales archaeon]